MTKRRALVVGNWKMNKRASEAGAFVRELLEQLPLGRGEVEVGLAPPFPALAAVGEAVGDTGVLLAAQNCHPKASGAYTGEVSAEMLADVGCRFVIVGHSERRQFFGETDVLVNQRAQAVVRAGMVPIVCIGETLGEREAGKTLQVVGRQLDAALSGFTPAQVARWVFAYEPVWAIGTGKTATAGQAQEVHAALRELLTVRVGRPAAESVRLQYGGSVKPDNAAALMAQSDIDGALVGGASLSTSEFAAIVRGAVAR